MILLDAHVAALKEESRLLFSEALPKAYEAHVEAVLDKVREYPGQGGSLGLEAAVRDASNRLSAEILKTAFLSLDGSEPWIVHEGRRYRRADRSTKRVMTTFGPVEYERSRYRRKGFPSVFPADRAVGLIEGCWTPLAARNALFKLSFLPPRDCVRDFRKQGGMCPSVSSLIRLYEAAGRNWEAIADAAYEEIRAGEDLSADASVATVQIDGLMVPMAGKSAGKQGSGAVEWREAACGTVTVATAAGDIIRTIRHGRMPETGKASLKRLIRDEVAHLLAKRPDLRLVTVANGAHDNWRFLGEAFPDAEQVLDFFHAAEKLKEAVDLAYGKDSDKGGRRYGILRERLLTEPGGADGVIRSLDHLRRRHSPDISKAISYFRNNRQRMNYAECKAAGFIIGSGIVESTNKNLITQRMKRSGMKWRHAGGQAIVTLRALALSDRFDHAWDILQSEWKSTNCE